MKRVSGPNILVVNQIIKVIEKSDSKHFKTIGEFIYNGRRDALLSDMKTSRLYLMRHVVVNRNLASDQRFALKK